MDDRIRRKLIQIAREGNMIYYSDLNQELDLGFDFKIKHHQKMIGELLGEISESEYEKSRPLLSSLVIRKNDKEQGDGWYKLCSRLFGKPVEYYRNNKEFEKEKIEDCYTFWQQDDNYEKYKDDY